VLSTEERRRLTIDLDKDPINPLAVIAKCIAALLLLVIIAAGPWVLMTAGGPKSTGAERASAQVEQAAAESN
jgi:hypothetical protein